MGARYGDEVDLLAIDKVRDIHVGALNSGNADAWVGLFSDDGVQMPPNAPANVGKEDIGHWSRGLLNNFRVQFGLTVDEVRVLGDWAFERGDYAISLTPAAGGPSMQDRGNYVTIYQKAVGEEWQMDRATCFRPAQSCP
jgi:uncharacterized protein (TIGR02246 family)